MDIEEKALIRAKLYDMVMVASDMLMPITVFSVYSGMGNELSLSKLTLCTAMLHKLSESFGQSQSIYGWYLNMVDSLYKISDFYRAPEAQKNMIKRVDAASADEKAGQADAVVLSVKGNFSWGVTPKLD